ncbi:3-keto-disaccharide hydrolase [Planctomicrobium sp. SH668]|uniref:3-keto-disaccharide hydrolase n=1 Tax=Planctomicrobium sp. SH668 TaxID=3448126 RepID=UPI003F5B6517
MKIFSLSLSLLVFVMSGCGGGQPPAPPAPAPTVEKTEPKFEVLTLKDFTPFMADEGTWGEEEGEIHCTGIPKGYLYSKSSYRNYTLKCEIQFPVAETDGVKPVKYNTGVLLGIQEPHKVWPASIEVQGRVDSIGSIVANGGVPALTISDKPDVREAIRKPVGEWNAFEINVKEGAVVASLNGSVICRSEPTYILTGAIGFQAEGNPVNIRNVQILVDSPAP